VTEIEVSAQLPTANHLPHAQFAKQRGYVIAPQKTDEMAKAGILPALGGRLL